MTDRPSHALRAIVRGRVQGVGFRDYVETRARSLGLTGYVRNLKRASAPHTEVSHNVLTVARSVL